MYYLAADKFGWTPSQVDEQPAVLLDWILSIAGVINEVQNEKMSKHK